MLRLKPPGFEHLFLSPVFEATFGGEGQRGNSLAYFGVDAVYVTVLPGNPIADACIGER